MLRKHSAYPYCGAEFENIKKCKLRVIKSTKNQQCNSRGVFISLQGLIAMGDVDFVQIALFAGLGGDMGGDLHLCK